MDTNRLKNMLVAAASLIGFDQAIKILQTEREPVLSALDRYHLPGDVLAMPIKDLIDLRSAAAKSVPTNKRQHARRAAEQAPNLGKIITTRVDRGERPSQASIRASVLKGVEEVLGHGPATETVILSHLAGQGIILNEGAEVRKLVTAIIRGNDRFARGSSGNTYKLRENARPKAA